MSRSCIGVNNGPVCFSGVLDHTVCPFATMLMVGHGALTTVSLL